MTITEEINGSQGRYVLETEAGQAEMGFSIASPGLRIVDHTGVPKALEGQGIAGQLMKHLVERARAEGFKVVPLCPYVNAQRRRHPDWADIFSV
ncbi:MAG: GNAT family N-acetyltransferase [Pseudomonadota bacterium]